jgi:hypothetical protein
MRLETDDGVLVYVHGLRRNDTEQFFAGAPNYFTMSFETGNPKYAWLDRTQAVAKGRLDPATPDRIRFDVYELQWEIRKETLEEYRRGRRDDVGGDAARRARVPALVERALS